ncbi:MAG: hypothetical protein BMS9Abin02_2167 [Anaerolineae bacterium]|nr:MAG: hypothetical protein BMS9Abin02_2167 [Anaerolineae bacterium]
MRIEMKRDRELAKRKGNARRTIVGIGWLALCFTVAYFLSEWLFEQEILDINFFYSRLLIPRTVNEIFVQIGFMAVIVILMQFLILIGYAFSSPIGRMRPGRASPYSRDPDLDDHRYDYR